MAEFVGAIIGLVATGVQVGRSLNDLIANIREAPREFRTLWTEEVEFREILSEILEARQLGDLPIQKEEPGSYAEIVLERSFEKLQEVRHLVQSVIKQQHNPTASPRVDKLKWILKVRKAQKAQNELRMQKSAIQAIRSDANVKMILEELRMQSQVIAEGRSMLMERQDLQLALLEEMTQRAPLTHGKPQEEDGRQTLIESGKSKSLSVERKVEEGKGSGDTQAHIEGEEATFVTALRSAKRQPLKCFKDCSCRCHQRSVVRTPHRLSLYMGDVFLGFSSLPWAFQSLTQCNVQSCRRSRNLQADMRYHLPPWLTINSIRFSLAFSIQRPPISISIETRNTIPYDSPIHLSIQSGHIDKVKYLLCSRTASLNDVDPFGLGVLYYASHYCGRSSGHDVAITMTQQLLEMGAHADWEDEIGNTPAETMTDNVLATRMINGNGASTFAEEQLVDVARIFGKCSNDLLEDYAVEMEFSPLHEVLLGLAPVLANTRLKDYLASFDKESLSKMIDTIDARGRTPLAWAVEFGCPEAVDTLIQYGANPNQLRRCTQATSPLLHLVIAAPASQQEGKQPDTRFLDVVRILLRHRVDVNAVDHEGWTALHVAASWNLLDMVAELARMGGTQLNWDAITTDGQTALDLCRGGACDEQVEAFLMTQGMSLKDSFGADMAGITRVQQCASENDSDVDSLRDEESYFDAPERPG